MISMPKNITKCFNCEFNLYLGVDKVSFEWDH